MFEERPRLKKYILLITYAIVLLVALSHMSVVFGLFNGLVWLLKPFLIAICLAYVLNILLELVETRLLRFMTKLHKPFLKKLKRPLAIVLILVVVIGFLYALVVFTVPQLSGSVSTLVTNIPTYVKSFEEIANTTLDKMGLNKGIWANISINWKDIMQKAGDYISKTFPPMFAFAKNITNALAGLATSLLIAIYMLGYKECLLLNIKKVIYAFLPTTFALKTVDTAVYANTVFKRFFSGVIIRALIMGIASFIIMFIMGVPYPILLSLMLALGSLIPIIGPLTSSILTALIVLLVDPGKALWYLLGVFVIQQIDGLFIYPKIVGKTIGLNGLWILFALIVGGSLFGIFGMVVGVPAFAVIYALVRKKTNEKIQTKKLKIDGIDRLGRNR